ncbi:MAG: selenium metabolism-associated LysR family transcriptional regulator [Nitrospirota bacterium]
MEDHRLKAFCLVVEMKSFSKAAEAKFLTQSAMSHLIKNLEDELGVKLLERESKTVTPTPAGRLFYDYAKQILELYKKMENDVYSLVHKARGPLSIGASPTAATYLLPQVFYSFSKNYPEVQIEVSVSNTESTIDYLCEGMIDIGIVEGNPQKTTIHLEEIAEDEMVIIASDDNLLTKKKPLTPQDLISQPFIMPETGSGTRELVDDFLHNLGIEPGNIKVSMTLGNPELIVRMVQSGMGISFVSKWSVFSALKDGSIKLLHMPTKRLRRKFYLISLHEEPSTVAARTFRKFIREYKFFMPF